MALAAAGIFLFFLVKVALAEARLFLLQWLYPSPTTALLLAVAAVAVVEQYGGKPLVVRAVLEIITTAAAAAAVAAVAPQPTQQAALEGIAGTERTAARERLALCPPQAAAVEVHLQYMELAALVELAEGGGLPEQAAGREVDRSSLKPQALAEQRVLQCLETPILLGLLLAQDWALLHKHP